MRRRTLLTIVIYVLALTAAYAINAGGALVFYPRAVAAVAALPPEPPYRAGQRLLVVSPHPDDETLCCAGSIQQAQAAGARVDVVWLTSGDGFELDAVLLDRAPRPSSEQLQGLGQRRIQEARAAMRALRVPQNHLTFLGYPDGGLLHMALENYATPFRSRYTRTTQVPYAGTRSPGAAYTGLNLERDLRAVLDQVKPDLVLAPSPEDQHPDHRATSFFITRLMAARGQADRLRYWIVHGGLEYPVPKGLHEHAPLLIAPRGRQLAWRRLDLTPVQEEAKRLALTQHRSQMSVMSRFLLAFVRDNELLTPELLPDPSGP